MNEKEFPAQPASILGAWIFTPVENGQLKVVAVLYVNSSQVALETTCTDASGNRAAVAVFAPPISAHRYGTNNS